MSESGRREMCEQRVIQCVQTWLVYQITPVSILFIVIPFAEQLPLTILSATALCGTWAARCAT